MREIKFRGKRTDNGEWVYGYAAKFVHGLIPVILEDTEDGIESRKINPHTVGQFTGLSDYDGAEIFEGDIVKCSYTHPVDIGSFDGPNEQEETVIGAVEYRNGCFFIGVYDIGSFDIDEMEIIGNIHDNPELLKTE